MVQFYIRKDPHSVIIIIVNLDVWHTKYVILCPKYENVFRDWTKMAIKAFVVVCDCFFDDVTRNSFKLNSIRPSWKTNLCWSFNPYPGVSLEKRKKFDLIKCFHHRNIENCFVHGYTVAVCLFHLTFISHTFKNEAWLK